MLRKASRRWLKHAMSFARVKILYSRITLTKWTTMFFFQSIAACLVLVIVPSLTLKHTFVATDIISELLEQGNLTRSLIIFDMDDKVFKSCQAIPSSPKARCLPLIPGRPTAPVLSTNLSRALEGGSRTPQTNQLQSSNSTVRPSISRAAVVDGRGATVLLDEPCLQSLLWLDNVLRTSKREDAVTILYNIWLMSISIVAILNESLIHLVAAQGAHALGTAWVGSTVLVSRGLEDFYRSAIVGETCPVDVLGNWWQIEHNLTYISIILNGTATLASFVLALTLYRVYAKDTFSRAGSSPTVHRAYKLVLLLSVLLQLSGFFLIAWAGVMIDRLLNGLMTDDITCPPEYIVFAAVNAVLIVPWLVLGWKSVRKEQRPQFFIFVSITVAMLALSSCMFISDVYRFLLSQCKFFEVLTVTSFVFVTSTAILGLCCYLSFGRGLATYLQMKEAPEGTDFTPVVPRSSDLEKGKDYDTASITSLNEKAPQAELVTVQLPQLAYRSEPRPKVPSIYSDPTRLTIKLSGTPPIARIDSPFSVNSDSKSDDTWDSSSGSTIHISQTSPRSGRGLPSNPKALRIGNFF